MSPTAPKEIICRTPQSDVRIRSFCTPKEVRRCSLNGEFGNYANYKSLYTKRETLEKIAGQSDANVVLALIDNSRIIGFGVLAYPESGERWAELGSQVMMEVKAIEVARSWRKAQIASSILKMVVDHPLIEDKVAYMVGYSWTWDLEGTQKTGREYRNILVRLFESCGFQEYRTNEPNICLKSENVFMCRIGKNISEMILNRFKWLRFGLSPWTWANGGQTG